MRNNEKLFVSSIAASVLILALFLPAAQAQTATPGYTILLNERVIGEPNQKNTIYEVTTDGVIPKKPDSFIEGKLCFGYAWIGDPHVFNGIGDPNERPAVITTMGRISSVTSDPCQIGDPDQKKTWDTQTVRYIKPNGPVCLVSIGDPDQRMAVKSGTLRTSLPNANATIMPSTFELAASFEIQLDTTSCPVSSTTGLKVVPISIGDPHV